MLLRASGETLGEKPDVSAITDPAAAESSGIEHAAALLAFADAAVVGSDAELDAARAQLLAEMGSECLVDAAGVVSNFERMVRIADGSGIPLDEIVDHVTGEMRVEMGLDRFGSAANTTGS
jgi:hypothetical protein